MRKQRSEVRSQKSPNALIPLMQLPVLPTCLLRDEIPLPDTYVAPSWTSDIIAEWQCEAALIAADTYPTQSVLIHGPSGVGKTTAARWIAKALDLPVVTMLLSTTVESYLGATGKNIERALRYATGLPCVLVMDELDAVAASREAKHNDVGEMWRITNTFIQILDQWHGKRQSSLLVGTTNLVSSIDSAIRRRFDVELEVPMPTNAELSKMAGTPLPDDFVVSHAEMRRLVLRARRQAILRGVDYSLALRTAIGSLNGHQ